MPIIATPTALGDVFVIEPEVLGDERGYFYESFNQHDFEKALGQSVTFVQDNHSSSTRGILRGLHYQLQQTQGKLVRVIRGMVFDVAVDLRASSTTYGKWVGTQLSSDNRKQHWVPPGFAHGFLVLSDVAEVLYKTTDYWHPTSEQCIRWNDPSLNIQWPDLGCPPILSAKDVQGVSWSQAVKF